jgi:hypothetical protein
MGRMDVTSTIGVAFDRAVRMMFKPFVAAKWSSLGFIVLLESCIEGGTTPGSNYRIPSGNTFSKGDGSFDPGDLSRMGDEAIAWVDHHRDIVIAVAVSTAVVVLTFKVLFLWLGCRGQVMLVRAVALDDERIGEGWNATARSAGSLFRFRLVLFAVGLLVGAGTLAAGGALVWPLLRTGSTDIFAYVVRVIPVVVIGLVPALVLSIVASLLRSFVVPLMVRFDESCTGAWRRFGAIARANVGPVVLFVVLRSIFEIGAYILALVVTLMTCCIGGLPYLHQVLMSPYYVFDRAWSLYALGSLGPDYQMIQERPPPPQPTPWGGT